jgi:hypothetical protein
MQLLTVAPRYCSTPGEANAGYVAGLLAQHARAIVRVDFLMPLPLGAPLPDAVVATIADVLAVLPLERIEGAPEGAPKNPSSP